MAAGHGRTLHLSGNSAAHRLAPQVKVVALLLFVLAVISTPTGAWWAFAGHATVVLAAARVAHVPLGFLAPRLVIEVPFVVFALATPFVAAGPRMSVGPLELSEPGLVAAAGFLLKGTLGVLASLLLAATTQARDLVVGVERLRLPRGLVAILGFMVRYIDVVADDLRRMQTARAARGFTPRHLGSWPVIAAGAGALFIRSFERGERVHLAMLSRGYSGTYAVGAPRVVGAREWLVGIGLPLTAWAVTAAALAVGYLR